MESALEIREDALYENVSDRLSVTQELQFSSTFLSVTKSRRTYLPPRVKARHEWTSKCMPSSRIAYMIFLPSVQHIEFVFSTTFHTALALEEQNGIITIVLRSCIGAVRLAYRGILAPSL